MAGNSALSARDKSYLEAFMGPLSNDVLETVDGPKEVVMEYRNFDPKKLLTLLIDRASASNTSPEQFHEDMKSLMIMAQKKKSATLQSIDGLKIIQLEKKYDVLSEGLEPDCVTHSRLGFMFPQYFFDNIEQFRNRYDSECPVILQYPESGGLLPSPDRLSQKTRRTIIIIMLYWMFLRDTKRVIPLRTHQALVKQRMKTGTLSDDRRIRVLQNKEVITLYGDASELTKKGLQHVEAYGKGFKDKILWTFFE